MTHGVPPRTETPPITESQDVSDSKQRLADRRSSGESKDPTLRELIARGGRVGVLPIEDVHAALLREGSQAGSLEDFLALAEARGIRLVEARKKNARARRVTRKRAQQGESPSDDPVRAYLSEMSQTSLLTREGEIEIARRIETEEVDYQRSVLGTEFAVAEVLQLAEDLKNERVSLRNVLDGFLEAESQSSSEQSRKRFFQKIAKYRRLHAEVLKKTASLSNSRTGKTARERLSGERKKL